MRAIVLAILLLAAPLSGCLTGADDDPPGNPPEIPPGNDPPGERGGAGGGDGGPGSADQRPAPQPTLAPGLTYVYDASGTYSTGASFAVVVARATADAYLFAGGSPADLVEDVHWNRSWHGWQTLSLNPRSEDGSGARFFDFPLTDGKTWSWGDGTVTAERTTVETPGGSVDGFRMTLTGTSTNRTWAYAPTTGYLTAYTAERGGTTYLDITLTEITDRTNATWYRSVTGTTIEGTPGNTGTIGVTVDADTVSISAGGWQGGRTTVLPPVDSQQTPWTYEAAGGESWTYDRRPPAEGEWRVTTSAGPDGYAAASLTAVNWTTVTPRYL